MLSTRPLYFGLERSNPFRDTVELLLQHSRTGGRFVDVFNEVSKYSGYVSVRRSNLQVEAKQYGQHDRQHMGSVHRSPVPIAL